MGVEMFRSPQRERMHGEGRMHAAFRRIEPGAGEDQVLHIMALPVAGAGGVPVTEFAASSLVSA